MLNDAAKEARRAYKREWNRKNRDKVKLYSDRYWTKKAQEANAAQTPAENAANAQG